MGIDGIYSDAIKHRIIDLCDILNAIDQKDLQPAINELGALDTYLEFKLHKLQFVHLLTSNRHSDAMAYAKSTFPKFASSKMKEIQTLMGAFIFANRLETSPYAAVFEPRAINTQWREVREAFSKDSFTLMGLPQESLFSTTVTVGIKSLPTFIKLASFSVLKGVNDDSLTVEIEVDQKFKFHSIFACPVSREQSTKANPPVLLQCGHLLAKNSMTKLVKGSSGKFKCPYCPTEQNSKDVKVVNF
eukprot:gene7994-9389_t